MFEAVNDQKVKVEVTEGRVRFCIPAGAFYFNGRSCPNINFFTSEVILKEWRPIHPDVDGEIMDLDEAFEYAKRMLQDHIH